METETITYVKCCDRNKDKIYFLHEENRFYLHGSVLPVDLMVESCPWCGILLDTNLLED